MNRVKQTNASRRDAMAAKFAKQIKRQNPGFDHQQVMAAAFRAADLELKKERRGGAK